MEQQLAIRHVERIAAIREHRHEQRQRHGVLATLGGEGFREGTRLLEQCSGRVTR